MARDSSRKATLRPGIYAVLAEFRYELRCFHHFSEAAASREGLSPRQHQALLSIRGSPESMQTVGELVARLLIRPHSASGLANRLVGQGLLERIPGADRRVVRLRLTPSAEQILERLSAAHLAELKRIRPLLKTLIERIR